MNYIWFRHSYMHSKDFLYLHSERSRTYDKKNTCIHIQKIGKVEGDQNFNVYSYCDFLKTNLLFLN
jgi:hypothetical protein